MEGVLSLVYFEGSGSCDAVLACKGFEKFRGENWRKERPYDPPGDIFSLACRASAYSRLPAASLNPISSHAYNFSKLSPSQTVPSGCL